MALNNIIFIFLIFIQQGFAKTKIPEFITKQKISNLRFISHNGKFTYYQRRSGALLLGTNYSVKKILQSEVGSNYLVSSSPTRKKILIAEEKRFHTFFSLKKLKKLYVADFDGNNLIFLGEGINPQLQLDDSRVSFYHPYKKMITIKRTHSKNSGFHINIMAKRNPYFRPQVIMLDVNTILFTDLNKQGLPGVVKYSKNNKKLLNLYKVPTQNKKIELCKKDNQIIMGIFSLDPIEPHSYISFLTPPKYEQKIIYKSPYNDIGNMVCSIKGKFIYFIKKTSSTTDVARLNIETKHIEIISDISYATQIIDMDSNLLLPYQGKYYLLLGQNDTTQFDLLKKRDSQ